MLLLDLPSHCLKKDCFQGRLRRSIANRKPDELTRNATQHAYATIITASGDSPLMHAASTPLEVNHTALVMGFAHQARAILGVRGLDTGTARDVHGILRVSRGATMEEEELEEKEISYFLGVDGGVRVFERGC